MFFLAIELLNKTALGAELNQIIRQMIKKESKDRPTMEQVKMKLDQISESIPNDVA